LLIYHDDSPGVWAHIEAIRRSLVISVPPPMAGTSWCSRACSSGPTNVPAPGRIEPYLQKYGTDIAGIGSDAEQFARLATRLRLRASSRRLRARTHQHRRMVAALASRAMGEPVNRKRVRRIMGQHKLMERSRKNPSPPAPGVVPRHPQRRAVKHRHDQDLDRGAQLGLSARCGRLLEPEIPLQRGPAHHDQRPTVSACRRSLTSASRLPQGGSACACSIVARIEVVSCDLWSTPNRVNPPPMIGARPPPFMRSSRVRPGPSVQTGLSWLEGEPGTGRVAC
jgi:hypothetical protein